MNEHQFLEALKDLKINLTEKQMQQLNQYANELIEYNKHTNLTAIKEINDIYLKHFYDSLTITKVIPFDEKLNILDIGTGAGFPGLVLAICFPNYSLTLLDSNHKKIDFLNIMISNLDLKNVKTELSRSEEYTKNNREEFDIITSRAVAELRILLEISFPAIKTKGNFIAMKSNLKEELENSLGTIEVLKGKIISQEEFELPFEVGRRTLLKIQKLEETDLSFPRLYATILKKPLKKDIK